MNAHLNRQVLLGLMLLGLLCLIGCSTAHPTPKIPVPAAPMIQVDGNALPSVTFINLVSDMPGGRIIGYHYEGMEYVRQHEYAWDQHFVNQTHVLNDRAQDVLGEAGYRTVADESGALQLNGTMARISFNSYARKISFDQAECEMNWTLTRAGENVPLFTMLTLGSGRVDAGQTGAIGMAFELALRRLLVEPDFVAAVKGLSGS